MRVPPQLDESPKPMQHWWQALQRIYQLVGKAINGNIEFGDPQSGPSNVKGVWVSVVTPGAPDTDFVITHNLGKAAVGFLQATKSAACDVYNSPTANPNLTTQAILRATVANVTLTLFVF